MSAASPADRRADIEGLRAISVIAVVLYHAHIAGFSGGFVGVDVFFVISGFLITRILLNEGLSSGTVALKNFWLRRAVRLLPNASLTLVTTLIAGFWLMARYDHPDLVKDVLSAAFYISNFRFASSAVDYFRVNDTHSPVLNFWSLSVEEQYYIVFPLMLLALFRFASQKRLLSVQIMLALIWLSSFALSILLVKVNHTQAFFNTASRAWELATGALLAACYGQVLQWPKQWRIGAAWLGLAGIIGSILLLKDGMMLPGFWVLIPTLGCAAIIAANGESSALNTLIGHAPARWLGARSYSLYLWHWPIFTFLPLLLGASARTTLIMLALAVLVSALAYALVENPIRLAFHRGTSRRRPLVAMSGLVAGVVVAGLVILAIPVFGPAPANQAMLDEVKRASADTNATADAQCLSGYYDTRLLTCRHGDTKAKKRVVVLGDSHATMWFGGLDAGARQAGWAMEMFSKVVCPAADITTWKRDDRTRHQTCDAWREQVLQKLTTAAERPDLVLLTSLNQLSGDIIDRQSGAILSGEAARAEWQRGLEATLKRLTDAGLQVAVLRDIPQARPDYRQCLTTRTDPAACDRSAEQALDRISPEEQALKLFPQVVYVDWSDLFCPSATGTCPLMQQNRLIYRDNHHVTDSYATAQAARFAALLRRFD